jgi:hypothetical protein
MKMRLFGSAVFFPIALLLAGPTEARQWKPDVHASALDYSQIFHVKPTGEIVLLWWVVPEIFVPNANNMSMLNVLSHYVILGVAQGRPGPNGAVAFENVPPLQIADQMSRNYLPIQDNALPAEVSQAIANLRALATQSQLGPQLRSGQVVRFSCRRDIYLRHAHSRLCKVTRTLIRSRN